MQAILIAGGEGRRIQALAHGTPKPLLEVGGRAIIEHQIALCRRYDIREIHLTVREGDAPAFRERLGTGEAWGAEIHYHAEREPLGTAGGVLPLLETLGGATLVLYGDILINMDLAALQKFHSDSRAAGTLVVHPTDHPLDSDLVEVSPAGRIGAFHAKPRGSGADVRNLGNAGAYILTRDLAPFLPDGPADFVRDVFPAALRSGITLYGYRTREYLKDTGTPDRLGAVRSDWAAGRVRDRHRDVSLPAVFFDRDGTLCRLVPFLHRASDIVLMAGAAQAVRQVNLANWLAVVVTNQPVVARGQCTPEELERIHARMEMLLGREGAVLDAIYHCPHHPDGGYDGEVAALKTRCGCRKPGGELIRRAACDLNIDLARSVLVGDSTRDVETGRRLGLRTVLVKTGNAGTDGKYAAEPDASLPDLAAAVAWAIGHPAAKASVR